jgi:hypothetical protein
VVIGYAQSNFADIRGTTITGAWTDIATLTISVGAGTGSTATVKLDGSLQFSDTSDTDCYWKIVSDAGDESPEFRWRYNAATGSVTWASTVPTGVTQTFRLKAFGIQMGAYTPRAKGTLTAVGAPVP